MIYFSCLLVGIGLADLIRARFSHLAATVVGAAIGAAATTGLLVAVGANLIAVPVSVALIAAWVTATSLTSFTVRKLSVVALGVLGVVSITVIPPSAATGAAQQWWAGLDYSALAGVEFGQALATASVLVFLIESANIAVRSVLELADEPAQRPTTRGRLGARRPQPETLKGGRIIGPLERVFLFALAMAGQFTAIGAIVAAKGIVRFPELSRDTHRGHAAEMFLVGSFSSWALVLLALLYVKLST